MTDVVHIINDFNSSSGGAEKLVQRIHSGLNFQGINSTLVGISTSDEELKDSISLNAGSIYSIQAIWRLYIYIRTLPEHIIIHAHLFPTIFYLTLLKKLKVFENKIFYTEHSTSNRRRFKWWGRYLDKFIYTQIDQVVAISDGTKKELVKWQPVMESKIIVIPNGIKLKHTEFITRPLKKKKVLISVGRLTEAKNYKKIILVLSKLKFLDFEYHIVGEGNLRNELETLIEQCQLQDRIVLHGYQEDVDSLLLQADIFLALSVWEGFGLAALEAMNASLAVIASDISGLRELFRSNKHKTLVDPKSEMNMCEVLRELMESDELRHNLAESCFHSSLEFSEENMVAAYHKLYTH